MKIWKLIACSVSATAVISLFGGCDKKDPFEGAEIGENSFIMTLYPDVAPETCSNFQKLVNNGFYNGLTFHRVVDEFVAQGGDPNGDGTGKSDEAVKGEFAQNGVENSLSHVRGTVSMARAEDFDSATCQFFICYQDIAYLDGLYAAFGSVTEGMEVVDGFLDVPRSIGRMGEISVPDTPIYIQYAGEIEPDEAGNPRVQFMIYIDESYEASTEEDISQNTTTISSTSTDISSSVVTDIIETTASVITDTVAQ